jgi:hypothetical protein
VGAGEAAGPFLCRSGTFLPRRRSQMSVTLIANAIAARDAARACSLPPELSTELHTIRRSSQRGDEVLPKQ